MKRTTDRIDLSRLTAPKLKNELDKKNRRLFVKRGINKAQMSSNSWREGVQEEAMESMGIDKQGNVLSPKAE